MIDQISQGKIVEHKLNGLQMIVVEEHILLNRFQNNKMRREFTCRWYHKDSGAWQLNTFFGEELKLVDKVAKENLGFNKQ